METIHEKGATYYVAAFMQKYKISWLKLEVNGRIVVGPFDDNEIHARRQEISAHLAIFKKRNGVKMNTKVRIEMNKIAIYRFEDI